MGAQPGEPRDRTALLVTESIMLLSVLGGVGSLPLLEARGLRWYWIVTLAAGILTILAGVWYALRGWLRAHRAKPGELKSWRKLLARVAGGLVPAVRSLFSWQDGKELSSMLPRFAVLTGVLILVPILASWRQQTHRIEIYFCSPAFLIWIAEAGYYAFPILPVKPKHLSQVAGLGKSGLQALSGLLLWVYLGLSVELTDIDWMFWTALALAILSGVLGIVASTTETEQEPAQAGSGVLGGDAIQPAAGR